MFFVCYCFQLEVVCLRQVCPHPTRLLVIQATRPNLLTIAQIQTQAIHSLNHKVLLTLILVYFLFLGHFTNYYYVVSLLWHDFVVYSSQIINYDDIGCCHYFTLLVVYMRSQTLHGYGSYMFVVVSTGSPRYVKNGFSSSF